MPRTQEVNRLQKLLEGANSKLGDVASDMLGKSGRCMLDALAYGEQDPQILADLARGRLRGKVPDLRRAVHGQVQAFQRVLLQQVLAHLDLLDAAIAHLQHTIAQCLEPYQEAVTLLQTIVGVGEIAASVVVAEVGVDMQRFPSAKHLASWAGVCPGNKQSAGKRLGGQDDRRQRLAEGRPRRGRLGQCPQPDDVSRRPVPPAGAPARRLHSAGRRRAQRAGDRVSRAHDQTALP